MSDAILSQPAPLADQRLAYGHARLQFVDLRLPPGPGPHPGLIVIHGGFWRSRYDLLHIGHLCQALTAAGIATWNIEYRRVGDPGGGWPGTFHDLVRAANAVFAVADRYRVDRARVGAIGHSAGGQLALWLATHAANVAGKTLPVVRHRFNAAIALAGVLDLHAAATLGLSDHAVSALLGGSPAEVPERYTAASPSALIPDSCPRLLLHGAADDVVPVSFSEAFQAAASHSTVSARILPDTNHFDLIDPSSAAWPTVKAAILQTTLTSSSTTTYPSPTRRERDQR